LFALCGHDFDFGDLIKEFRCAGRLTQFLKFIQRNSQLPENLVEQWRADFAASLYGNGHSTAIRVVPSFIGCLTDGSKQIRVVERRAENRAPSH